MQYRSLLARSALASAALVASLASASASAIAVGDDVTVKNGTFEGTPGFGVAIKDWTLLDPTGEWFVGVGPNGGIPSPGNAAGSLDFALGYVEGWPVNRHNGIGIYQDVSGLVVGAQYTLSFDNMVGHTESSATERWDVTFGDQTLQGTVISQNQIWTHNTLTFTATSTTQRLTFLAMFLGATPGVTPEILALDNITLTVSAVPEPGTAALGLGGLLAIGVLMNRRRAAQRQS